MDRFPQGGEEHNNMYQLFYEDVIAYEHIMCMQIDYYYPTQLQHTHNPPTSPPDTIIISTNIPSLHIPQNNPKIQQQHQMYES